MGKMKKRFTATVLVCLAYAGSTFAAFGIGIHYTIDGSVKMPAENEQLLFDNLQLKTDGFASAPLGWTGNLFGPEDIPIYFDRGNMMRTPFGLGAKIYVDVFPFIDCIELSGDIVMFQYDGKIKYPVSVSVNPAAPSTPAELLAMIDDGMVSVEYDSISTNIEDLAGSALPGISKTPYIKLDLGFTIRKYIKLPVVGKFIRPYGGLGFDCVFATPVPSAGLVNDAIGEDLSGEKSISEITTIMSDPQTPQKVIDEIVKRLMTPHFGMNLMAGVMLKPPVFPFGIYVDGKFMIPFGKLDEDANVTGYGFRLDTGVCLHFGKAK